jgi:hypothetical protein
VAAHKEINRLEQTKTVPLAIDATAEPVPVATELTDARDGAERGKIISGPALNVSRGAASWPSMLAGRRGRREVVTTKAGIMLLTH